jgi:hypothetical protein
VEGRGAAKKKQPLSGHWGPRTTAKLFTIPIKNGGRSGRELQIGKQRQLKGCFVLQNIIYK